MVFYDQLQGNLVRTFLLSRGHNTNAVNVRLAHTRWKRNVLQEA